MVVLGWLAAIGLVLVVAVTFFVAFVAFVLVAEDLDEGRFDQDRPVKVLLHLMAGWFMYTFGWPVYLVKACAASLGEHVKGSS